MERIHFCLLLTTLVPGLEAAARVKPTHPPLREFPPVENVHVELVNSTSVIVHWVKPPKIVNHYIKFYQVMVRQALNEMELKHYQHVPAPVDHETIFGLEPEVLYNLRVSIVYTNKKYIFSSTVTFRTDNANVTSYCRCDPYGSKNSTFNNGSCIPNESFCICKELYTGSHCSLCTSGHYRELHRACDKCPCALDVSDGECEYDATIKRARCTKCKPNLDGPMCRICARGFFKNATQKECVKCSCPLIGSDLGHCDSMTGKCLQCPNGTVGFHCEACQAGWVGQAPFCRLLLHTLPHHSGLTLLASVLALAAVAVALGLGYWVMRLRARQKRLNAWSLELNRYELDNPGVVDTGSQSGLMMEEAVPGYGASDIPFDGAATAGDVVGPPGRKDDQLIFRAARLQLRQSEANGVGEANKGGPLV